MLGSFSGCGVLLFLRARIRCFSAGGGGWVLFWIVCRGGFGVVLGCCSVCGLCSLIIPIVDGIRFHFFLAFLGRGLAVFWCVVCAYCSSCGIGWCVWRLMLCFMRGLSGMLCFRLLWFWIGWLVCLTGFFFIFVDGAFFCSFCLSGFPSFFAVCLFFHFFSGFCVSFTVLLVFGLFCLVRLFLGIGFPSSVVVWFLVGGFVLVSFSSLGFASLWLVGTGVVCIFPVWVLWLFSCACRGVHVWEFVSGSLAGLVRCLVAVC